MRLPLSRFALAAALVGLGCSDSNSSDSKSATGGSTSGGIGGAAANTGGAATSGGSATTGGASASGGTSATGGLSATGGVSPSAGSNTGGTSSGGQPVTGGGGAGGRASGGAASGGPNSGGRSTGGQPVGGSSTGGQTVTGGRGGRGGASTGGASGGSSTGGQQSGGSSTGGTSSGGASGASTGGTGNTGTGGSQQCDTSWDTRAKDDGLALTPPMGWNSWNAFHESINEQQIKEVADTMVSSGMKDAGYVYLNLDDRWMDDDGRDAQGKLYGDSVRFPGGMKALADYVHALGLKLGVYGDRGTATCANVKDSGGYGHEELDAQTYADWGVDYLKYDNCNVGSRTSDQAMREDYEKMSAALKATGRPIVFSICAWDWKGEWMASAGHLWRSTVDIGPCFDCSEWYRSIVQIIDENNQTAQYAGPGHWNDPDMLEVGNSGLSNTEATAHFSLWAIMAAPLIAGNDIRSMSTQTHDILTNEEVIAVDQDPAGIQGTRVADNGDLEVWMKPLCNRNGPEKAVVLLNRGGNTAKVTVSFSDIGISGTATVRDLWAHQDLGESQGSFSADVPSHGVVMVKIVASAG